MNDEQLAKDIYTVARAEIVAAIEYCLSVGNISHESCPEVTLRDWEQIEARIKAIIQGIAPDDTLRVSAYDRLVARADG